MHTIGKNNRVKILDSYLTSGGENIAFVQGTDLIVEGNHLINSYDSSVSINSSGERINISGNVFDKQGNQNPALGFVEATNDAAGDANGLKDILINGNVMLNGGMSNSKGVLLQGPVTNASVSDNIIRNIISHGIYVSGGTNISIAGNMISDLGGTSDGIEIPADVTSSQIGIYANTVNNAGRYGLNVPSGAKGITNINISGNMFTSSTAYGINLTANVTSGTIQSNSLQNNASGSYNITGTGWKYFQQPDGSAAAPSYSFSSHTGSGFWDNGNIVALSINGVNQWNFENGDVYSDPSTSGLMLKNGNAANPDTPTIIPDRLDQTTGFAAGSQGNVSVIVGSVEKARWTGTGYGVGTSAPSGTGQFVDRTNNSSTVIIGASSTKQGCLEMGAASGTARLVYIWFDSNAAIYSTTTKPSFCM